MVPGSLSCFFNGGRRQAEEVARSGVTAFHRVSTRSSIPALQRQADTLAVIDPNSRRSEEGLAWVMDGRLTG
jgi:hypothetical protein